MTNLDRSKLGPRQNLLVDALLSGKYPQTRGRLMDTNGYCCLGVATVVYNVENPFDQETLDGKELGPKTRKFFDFDSVAGFFIGRESNDSNTSCLINMNDRGMSFEGIAKVICEKGDKLFNKKV